MHSYKFIVEGIVQKVYYRKNVSHNAQEKKLQGYVKNMPNGNVEALLTTEKSEDTLAFIQILIKGSPKSRVDKISYCKERSVDEKRGFHISYE